MSNLKDVDVSGLFNNLLDIFFALLLIYITNQRNLRFFLSERYEVYFFNIDLKMKTEFHCE